MDLIKELFDPYDRKARLYPALLSWLPIFLTIAVWSPGLYKVGAGLVGLVVGCGVLYVFSQFARTRGRKLENNLWESWGGSPTVIGLRRSSKHLNENTRLRYIKFFEENISGWKAPTLDEEKASQEKADQVYGSAVDWLRSKTRDTIKYPLVLKENIDYGFRRNILGLKPFAIPLTLIACGGGGFLLVGIPYSILITEKLPQITVVIISFGLMVWWVFGVNRHWVKDAASAYANALFGACDQS